MTYPTPDELLAGANVLSVPLNTRFRGLMTRETILLHGPTGWAEFAPFAEYDDHESARWLEAALEAGWGSWPQPVRDLVPVNATVPAVPAAAVADVLARFPGCTAVKVKVAEPGENLQADIDRVGEVRALMGPQAELKIDANGGWTLEEAQVALTALNQFDLAYAEQPVATVDEMATLRRTLAAAHVDVLIAADESIRKAEDPLEVKRREAADVVVVKAAPLGGVARALDIVGECGLPAVVSSALETSVGIRSGVALAAALPELPFACGLGTTALFAQDVAHESYQARNGAIEVRPAGEDIVDPVALIALAAPEERWDWWRDRVRRCAALVFGER